MFVEVMTIWLSRVYWSRHDGDVRELKIFLRVGNCVQAETQDAEFPHFWKRTCGGVFDNLRDGSVGRLGDVFFFKEQARVTEKLPADFE